MLTTQVAPRLSTLSTAVLVAAAVSIPFAAYVAAHAGPLSSGVRYGDEAVVDVAALVVLVVARSQVVARLEPLLLPLGVLVGYWLLTALWNLVAWQTVVVAIRSDLRLIGVVVLTVAATSAGRERLVPLAVSLAAAIQAGIAMLHAVGAIATQTTLPDRNYLAVFLAVVLVLDIAGGSGLGTRGAWVLGTVLVGGIVASTSREGVLAAAAGVAVVVFLRAGRRGRIALAAAAAVAAAVIAAPTIAGTGSGTLDARTFSGRWHELFSANFSSTTNFRSALLVRNAKLVSHLSPALGLGLGTATVPHVIEDLSSPVYRSFLDRDLATSIEPFVYDSNWAAIVLETGFVGVAVFAAFLVRLAWLARGALAAAPARALVGTIVVVAVAAFAGPSFREPAPTFVLWFLVGAVLALRPRAA